MQRKSVLTSMKARLRPLKRLALSYTGAMLVQHQLPPGKLADLHRKEINNQRHLLECMSRYGPIFKAWQDHSIVICVTGLGRIKRLMVENEELLRPVSVPVAAPFPKGLMRVMEGADHAKYRSQLNTALQAYKYAFRADSIDEAVLREIEGLLAGYPNQTHKSRQLNDALTRISTGLLLRMFFGVEAGSRPFEYLLQSYLALGPEGYVMQIGPAQERAFEKIRLFLTREMERAESDRAMAVDSVMNAMLQAGQLDEVSLGNLIYMVEIGRYDLTGLFRWMLNYAAQNPETQEELAAASDTDKQHLGLAFVNETLRLNQIERLLRSVRKPFVFDEFYFPRDALVRLCLWESHKSPELFSDPFRFDLHRLPSSSNVADDMLPFGFGKHRCPLASYNLVIGARFITSLATHYRIVKVADENPHRGRHHWEPASEFNVRIFTRKTQRDERLRNQPRLWGSPNSS